MVTILLHRQPRWDLPHGLQALPLFGYLLAHFAPAWLRPSYRVALVWTAGLSYLGLVGLLSWQALRGQPLTSPDAATLGALFALILAICAAFARMRCRKRGTSQRWSK